MHIIDGRKIAEEMEKKVRKEAEGKKIKIATIVVGESKESILFAKLKEKAFKRVGFDYETIYFEEAKQSKIENEVKKMNDDVKITGINIQLPLPKKLNYINLVKKIDAKKDIEGMNPCNIGNTLLGNENIVPCTPKAILKIIEHENIKLQGKNVVIINHSNIVGKPLAMLMLNRNATVSVCHVFTKNLMEYTKKADLLITATGIKWLIKGQYVKEGVIIIDAGIKEQDGKIYGDVHESAAKKSSRITPVPGGVGPVTIASVLENAIMSYKMLGKNS